MILNAPVLSAALNNPSGHIMAALLLAVIGILALTHTKIPMFVRIFAFILCMASSANAIIKVLG